MSSELLITRLEKHPKLRALFDESSHLPDGVLADSLMKEFEYVIDRYYSWSKFAEQVRRIEHEKAETPSLSADAPAQDIPLPLNEAESLHIRPIKIEVPSIDLQGAEKKLAAKRAEENRKKRMRKQLDEVEHLIHSEIEKDWETKSTEVESRAEQLKTARQVLRKPIVLLHASEEQEPAQNPMTAPPRPDFTDDDVLYIHGAALAADSTSEPGINALDGINGIDETGPVFVLAYQDFNLFISKVQRQELTVTRSGMLLLNKEDSLRYCEEHEAIVNQLRNNELVLPFEFGSIVRGKEELMRKAASFAPALQKTIDAERKADTWFVKLRALNNRVSKSVAGVVPAGKMQERGRDEKRTGKRSDVKTLEKILQHERNCAETIHGILAGVSVSSEVAMLVSIGSGMSEDWKTILDASYKIPIINRLKFFSEICALQRQYRKMGFMFEVLGPSGRFSMNSEVAVIQPAND